MILDEMPENVDVDLLQNLYSLTKMSPLQSNQTMQTPQGLAGLPVVRRSQGSEGGGTDPDDVDSMDSGVTSGDPNQSGTGTGTSSSAGQSGQGTSGPDGAGPDGDNTTKDFDPLDQENYIGVDVASDLPPDAFSISQMGKGFTDRQEAEGDFAPTELDRSQVDVEKTGFESPDELAQKQADLEGKYERGEIGYNDLVKAGYFDIKEKSFRNQMDIDAINLQNQLKGQGFKDVSVTPNTDGTFSFDAPNFGEALGAGLSEMGRGFTGAVDTGMDLIGGIMSVTPTGLAEGAMRGTGPGGALTDMFGVSKPAQAIGRGLEGFLGVLDITRGIGKGVRDLAAGNIPGFIQSFSKLKNQRAARTAPAPAPAPTLNQAAPTGISSLTQPSLERQAIQDLIDEELSRRDQVTGFGRTAFMDT